MTKYTTAQIKEFLAKLKSGKSFCGIRNNRGVGHIYLTTQKNVGWEHYGQSANKATIDELRFVIETIFNDCDEIVPAVWSDYHINWIPLDEKYEAIDFSMFHPNVCGK